MSESPIAVPQKTRKFRRRLDHLYDITNGCRFTAVPSPLMELVKRKLIHPEKHRLILIMLDSSSDFHIRRTYLQEHCGFHPTMLKKFLPELIEDGIVWVEKVKSACGSLANIYHTNPVTEWRLREDTNGDFFFRSTSDEQIPSRSNLNDTSSDAAKTSRSSLNDSSLNDSDLNPLNENKGANKNKKKTKMVGWNEPSQPLKRDDSDPLNDPSLIDDCKRLEYCYKTKDTDYVNYKRTRGLLSVIRANHGQERLDQFIGWMEARWQQKAAVDPKFAFRSERMASHWLEYLEAHPRRPEPIAPSCSP